MALYVLDRNKGFSLFRAEVPWCSLVLLVQGLRDGVTLRGQVCVFAYVLNRIVDFSCTLVFLFLRGTKVFTWVFLFSSSFTMGSPILGSSIRIHTPSIGSKELLIAGCCALVLLVVLLFDNCLASSAAML